MQQNYKANVFPGQIVNVIQSVEADVTKMKGNFLGSTDDLYSYIDETQFSEFPQVVPCKTWMDLVCYFYSKINVDVDDRKFWGIAELDRYSDCYKKQKNALAEYLGIPVEFCDNEDYSYVMVHLDVKKGCFELKDGKKMKSWNHARRCYLILIKMR